MLAPFTNPRAPALRSDLENNRSRGIKLISGKLAAEVQALTTDVTIPVEGSLLRCYDPNGADRTLTLPAASRGLFYVVCHSGSAHTLDIHDALGDVVATLTFGQSAWLFSGDATWRALTATSGLFGPAGVGHSTGLVPDPGAISGLDRVLKDDGTWATIGAPGFIDAYKTISDGTHLAVASGLDQLRLRSSSGAVVLVVTNNDPTYGDVVDFTLDEANIDHDALHNFVANKHIDHTAVSINPGSGLSGGGDISTTRTLSFDPHSLALITPELADEFPFYDVSGAVNGKATFTTLNGTLDHNALLNYVASRHIDHSAVSVAAGSGLSGGGTIDTTRTLSLDIHGLTADTLASADELPFYDASGADTNKITFANLNATLDHNSLLNYSANQHVDHTTVSIATAAGTSGLTGGGTIASTRNLSVDINGLTADTSPDSAADYVMTYDASAFGLKKVLLNKIAPTAAALTKADDTNVTLTLGGSPTTALLQATSITVGWTGLLALSRLAQGTDGQIIVGQTSSSPLYKTISGDWTLSAAGAATLATVNANTGSWGSATQSPQFTVNGKGLITAAANVTITPAASSITGAGDLTKADDTNVTLTLGGTPTGSLLKSASITAGWAGTLALARGGLGGDQSAAAANTVPVYPGSGGAAVPSTLSTWFNAALSTTVGQIAVRASGGWVASALGYANPVWWGADPTGTTDSSSAFTSAVATGLPVFFPAGTFKFTAGWSTTIASGTCLKVYGAGVGKTELEWTAGGITLTIADHTATFDISDVTISTTLGSATGVSASMATGYATPANTAPSFLRHVTFRGHSGYAAGTDAWSVAVKLTCVSNVTFDSVNFFGSSSIGGYGVQLEGSATGPSYGVVYNFDNCYFYAVSVGMQLGISAGYIQGVNVTNTNFTGVNYGIYVTGPNGMSQLLVENCQIEAHIVGIYVAVSMEFVSIRGCLFLADAASFIGVAFSNAKAFQLLGNNFQFYDFVHSTPFANTQGIYVGSTTAQTGLIDGNSFDYVTYGIFLDTSSSSVTVGQNGYTNIGTAAIQDNGANNTPGFDVGWKQTTPTPVAAAGAFTTVTAAVRTKKIGKTVHWTAVVTYTTINTGTVGTYVPLGYTAGSTGYQGACCNTTTGTAMNAIINSGATSVLLTANGFVLGAANGQTVVASGTFETA